LGSPDAFPAALRCARCMKLRKLLRRLAKYCRTCCSLQLACKSLSMVVHR